MTDPMVGPITAGVGVDLGTETAETELDETLDRQPGEQSPNEQSRRRMRPARLLARTGWVAVIALPLVPLLSLRTYEDRLLLFAGAARPYQMVALGALALLALPTLYEETRPHYIKRADPVRRQPSVYLTTVVALAVFSTGWSDTALQTALDSAAITLTLASVWLCVRAGRIDGVFMLKAVSVTAAIALVAFGLTLGLSARTFGQIPANQIGKLALLVIFGAVLWAKAYFRWSMVAGGLAVLLFAESRGSLIALAVAVIVALAKTASKKTRRRALQLTGAGAGIVAGYGILSSGFEGALSAAAERLLRLSSDDRGLGSGGTGRLESWEVGVELFLQRPVLGHGFGTSGSLAQDNGVEVIHSGLMAAAVELGVVGVVLFVLAFGNTALALLKRAGRHELPGPDPDLLFACLLIAGLTLTVFEPNYLAVGFAFWLTTTVICFEGTNPRFTIPIGLVDEAGQTEAADPPVEAEVETAIDLDQEPVINLDQESVIDLDRPPIAPQVTSIFDLDPRSGDEPGAMSVFDLDRDGSPGSAPEVSPGAGSLFAADETVRYEPHHSEPIFGQPKPQDAEAEPDGSSPETGLWRDGGIGGSIFPQ